MMEANENIRIATTEGNILLSFHFDMLFIN